MMTEWLTPEENRETEQLYMEVFDDEPEAIREIYSWLIRDNRIIAKKDAGVIVSMIQIVPRHCRLFGREIILPYIFAVSTKREYRGMGMMRKLMETCLVQLASEHVAMTHLIPAVQHIYEKFGFAFIADGMKEAQPVVERERLIPVCDKEADSAAAGKVCVTLEEKTARWQDRHYSLARTENASYYTDMDLIYRCYGGGVSALLDHGEIIGYQIVSRDENRLLCDKQVFYERQAKNTEQKDFRYGEPKHPFVMGRLLDIPAFLMYLEPKTSFSVVLKMSDPVLPQNNGYFRFGALSGRFIWEHWESENTDCRFITLDIGTLTALLCGYEEASWLPKEDCLQGIYLWDVF